MRTYDPLEKHLDSRELAVWKGLDSPAKIQAYLDQVPYSTEYVYRSPLSVLRQRMAHCMDGALFAAAALRQLGHPPLVVDMIPEPGTDDDHILAIFKVDGHFGAVAKSNFVGLRYREPIYRSLRELMLSYFEAYFNLERVKTLRRYTRPINLTAFDCLNWEWDDAHLTAIEKRMDAARTVNLITPEMAGRLQLLDPLSFQGNMIGTNLDGIFKSKG